MSSNRNIFKNTTFLYIRMLLVMIISLYTSRIVLKELGISDFGIFSVVGGFVTLFAFLNAAMSSATQRYLTFDLAKNNSEALQKTFSATLTIHLGIALLVLLFAETFGLWYINNKMVFPSDRYIAVNFVYQFSVATALLGIIQVPYNSLIIASEKMSVYAYVGIAEVVLKLLIVFIIIYFGNDKLITYSFLTFLIALGIRLFYQIYCRKTYPESRYVFKWDKGYYIELITYSGWNLFGNLALVAKGQGSNLILNFFFGTTVNAAFGIMNTVNSAINNFVSNFVVASNPQIIKLYATGEHLKMEKLINQTTKFSFFLCLLLIAPFYLNINIILKMWLMNPPKYASEFVRITLLCILIDILTKPMMTGITATGKIKSYQFIIGLLNLLIVPISYILLKNGFSNSPIIILNVWLVFSILSFVFRIYFVKILMNYNLKFFFIKVFIPSVIVSFCCYFSGVFLERFYIVKTFFTLIIQSFFFTILIMLVIIFVGVEKNERIFLLNIKDNIFKKLGVR